MSSPTMDELTSPIIIPKSPLKRRASCVYTSGYSTQANSPTIERLSQSFPRRDCESAAEHSAMTTDEKPPVTKRPPRKAKAEAIDRSIAQSYRSPKKPRRRANSHCPLSTQQQQQSSEGTSRSTLTTALTTASQLSQSFTAPQSSGESRLKRKGKPGCQKLPKPKRTKKGQLEDEKDDELKEKDTAPADEEVITSTPKEGKARKNRVLDTSWLDDASIVPTTCRDSEDSSPTMSVSQRTYSVSDLSSEGDSDDEDLPDMLGSSMSHESARVEKGDLIWLKHGSYPFWPAVVKTVYKLKKRGDRMTVAFIGDIDGCNSQEQFCVSYRKKNVFPFGGCGHDQHQALKQEGLDSPYKEQFRNAFEEAEAYLFRKAKDDSIDIFDFFSRLFKPNHVHASTSTSVTDALQEGATIDTTLQPILPGTPDSSPNTSRQTEDTNNSPEFSLATLQRIQRRTIRHQKLVEFIKQEKCKNHLSDIFHSRVVCERHALFFKCTKTKEEKNELRYSGFGPIAEEEQTEEIIKTVCAYAQEWKKQEDDQLNVVDYCMSVLVPEAIIFAIQKVHRLKPTLAEEHFHKGAQYFREEELQMERQFDRHLSVETSPSASESESESER